MESAQAVTQTDTQAITQATMLATTQRPRLLVVDDEEPLLLIFGEFFEGLDYDLTLARSAEEAIAKLGATTFDLVVTDLNLPGRDGLAVLRAAKETNVDTEVIVLTGNASTLTAIDAMRQGAYDYVLKPFDLYEMERTIHKALERRQLLEENRRFVDNLRVANEELKSNQLALARHQEELRRRVDEATRRIRSLYEVGKEITSSLHLDRTLRLILQHGVELTGGRRGIVFLLHEETGQLTAELSQGLDEGSEGWRNLVAQIVEPNEKSLTLREPVQAEFVGASTLASWVLVVPLLQEGEAIGTVAVLSDRPDRFSDDDQDLLVNFASQASIAIRNASVYGKIRDLDRMKSEFVAVVSHEVRTPLTAIKGTLEILGDEKYFPADPDQREMIHICQANVSRLELLINDILDFSKLESSKLSTNFEPAAMSSLVESVLLHIGNLAGPKRIRLESAVRRDLPMIEIDSLRIAQVLVNLVANAIKFSPEGSTVGIEAEPEGDGLTVRIRDRGIGITPEDLPKLFTKFHQLNASTTRSAGGTGLGLVICKGIVEEHGGKIWVESTPGAGSCFSVWLPRVHAGGTGEAHPPSLRSAA